MSVTMKKATIKKWFKRAILAILFISVISFMWVDYHIDHLWGEHTRVVDHTQFHSPQVDIVITDVDVLSADGSHMIADQTVLIEQGEISIIASHIELPIHIKLINGEGKYLIPGLIDSHVHLWQSPNDLLLYIANGVTHVRELNGSDEHLKWKQEIINGRIGPNLFVASSRFNSNSLFQSWFQKWAMKITSINSLNSAENLVKEFAAKGYDAIKTYTFISNQDYWALNKATQKVGIPLLGHTPINMELSDVWKSNQKELAHIEELVKALIREFDGYNYKNADEFLYYVKGRSDEIALNLFNNKIAVVSTIWLMESFSPQKMNLKKTLNEVQLAYVNPGIIEKSPITSRAMGWLPDSNIYRWSPNLTNEKKWQYNVYWKTYAKAHHILLRSMVDKRVTILAGTDANVPVAVPGFSLHDELISLTQSGMSASQALISATSMPAAWMKENSGKIQAGYKADLLLLNKNPLENIENTKSIDSVIRNGHFYNRTTLNAMLKAIKKANDESRTVDIDEYL